MLDLPLPPAELGGLIKDMEKYEITETWSRYRSSSKKQENGGFEKIQHIPREILIPIVEFQERLDSIASLVSSRKAFGDTYEDELHEIWSQLNAELDQ